MQNQQRPLYVRDILSILENFAPLSLQESYDNAGLICGNPEAEIHSVLLSTDITEEVTTKPYREDMICSSPTIRSRYRD